MNSSGDAAEQIVKMTLEGVEVAARITGAAAKEIALLLIAALKSPDKTTGGNIKLKGKARLNSMLKSGKALEIFSVKERDLRTFVREAKQYGIVYCVLRNSKQTPDGLCDIMVRADDAPKINRLVERFKFATVDKAKIESEIIRDIEAHTPNAADEVPLPAEPDIPADAQPGEPEINDVDTLLDELMSPDGTKAAPEPVKAAPEKQTPRKTARTAQKDAPTTDARNEPAPLTRGGRNPQDSPPPSKTNPSAPSSGGKKKSENPISSRPSVKKVLREITAAKRAKEADALKREEPLATAKAKSSPATTHKQPQRSNKYKKPKVR